MDEVNHVKMVVSLLYYYYVMHACLLLHDDAVLMLYKYFWVKRFLNFFILQTSYMVLALRYQRYSTITLGLYQVMIKNFKCYESFYKHKSNIP